MRDSRRYTGGRTTERLYADRDCVNALAGANKVTRTSNQGVALRANTDAIPARHATVPDHR